MMCMECWEAEGRPFNASPKAREWAPRFSDAEFGTLHVITSDWNLDDKNLDSCREQNPTPVEIELLDALQGMSIEERWACAILAENPTFKISAALR